VDGGELWRFGAIGGGELHVVAGGSM
jgi:hypothetical protein